MDVVTYFIIRSVGASIPKAIFPFISGLFTSAVMLVYCYLYEPLDWGYFFSTNELEGGLTNNDDYTTAIQLSFLGCVFGWVGLEFMVIGLGITKSALASYGEMSGIIVPFTFDVLVLNRSLVATDFIGLGLIICLMAYQGYKSFKEA